MHARTHACMHATRFAAFGRSVDRHLGGIGAGYGAGTGLWCEGSGAGRDLGKPCACCNRRQLLAILLRRAVAQADARREALHRRSRGQPSQSGLPFRCGVPSAPGPEAHPAPRPTAPHGRAPRGKGYTRTMTANLVFIPDSPRRKNTRKQKTPTWSNKS